MQHTFKGGVGLNGTCWEGVLHYYLNSSGERVVSSVAGTGSTEYLSEKKVLTLTDGAYNKLFMTGYGFKPCAMKQ